jgi:DNA mismatch repair protein MutS
MRQYLDVKRQHRDAVVFFRMGDFYEMFYEDAVTVARALELTLTSRSKDGAGSAIPMCGVPYHAVDTYLGRLVRQGFRVAICDQVGDPKKAKGLVKREVTRVVSPGTLTDASYLDEREPAFLAAVTAEGDRMALGYLDVSTGDFAVAEFAGTDRAPALAAEIALLRPRELLAPEGLDVSGLLPPEAPPRLTRVDAWTFDPARARDVLRDQFQTTSLGGHGLEQAPAATGAAGALVSYLRETQRGELGHVRDIHFRVAADALIVDPVTLKHLNVVEGADGGRAGSLLSTLDRTVTAMGGRMLRQWLIRPLVTLVRIQDRLDAVEDFGFRTAIRGKIHDLLRDMHDIERLVARISLGTAGPRDMVALGQSLELIPRLQALGGDLQAPLNSSFVAEVDELADVREAITSTLVDEPPAVAREGGVIRDGVDPALDELRTISRGGKASISALEDAERARTGIGSLKVRYNRVFGYCRLRAQANDREWRAVHHTGPEGTRGSGASG